MGPTGAGKSALALELAKVHNGEIISADSRQIYTEMDIGTDKIAPRSSAKLQAPKSKQAPSAKLQASNTTGLEFGSWDLFGISDLEFEISRDQPLLVEGVPHYLIDILTPDQWYSAAEFRDDAQRLITDIHRRRKLPIVVGGTGFYIRVLTGHRSLPNVPPDPAFRAWADTQPVETLARELRERAPDVYATVDNLNNKRRVIRALEIAGSRGKKQEAAGSSHDAIPPTAYSLLPTADKFFKLALMPSPDTLHERLARRVEEQFRRGFAEEVRRLAAQYGESAPGLQAVGYRQMLPYLREETTLEEAKQAVLRAHREYARRQLTWLKKEPDLVRATSPEEARRTVTEFLRRKDSR